MAQPRTLPKTTVLFLLYSEEKYVPGLVQGILKQKGQGTFDVVFVDNGSRDGTLSALQHALAAAGQPTGYRIKHFDENQGISRALNQAFAEITTPYILTCHCDVLFGADDFVERMTALMDAQPKAGAIAGQPSIPTKTHLPFAEKLNLVANLQDVFPAGDASSLVPVGFVEGRCDIFRLDALRKVGFYDTILRLAGEDQVLAARMRAEGYELYQAPGLRYSLSVSSDQDSWMKLIRHQRLFGRAHPYIVLSARARDGLVGGSAGSNRQLRTLLRASQLLSSAVYLWMVIAILASLPISTYLAPLFGLALTKAALFGRHAAAVRFTVLEWLKFTALQPLLDVSYSIGLMHGIWVLAWRRDAHSIS